MLLHLRRYNYVLDDTTIIFMMLARSLPHYVPENSMFGHGFFFVQKVTCVDAPVCKCLRGHGVTVLNVYAIDRMDFSFELGMSKKSLRSSTDIDDYIKKIPVFMEKATDSHAHHTGMNTTYTMYSRAKG